MYLNIFTEHLLKQSGSEQIKVIVLLQEYGGHSFLSGRLFQKEDRDHAIQSMLLRTHQANEWPNLIEDLSLWVDCLLKYILYGQVYKVQHV